ncbi:MAG TPA: zf-HC2 domain-containing protein [Thermoanaerobaculia bacterium]|jgi:hypothetical protein|nr:zf-HC2 domain-containing protein [Thermoanaerobaculia bacterium]
MTEPKDELTHHFENLAAEDRRRQEGGHPTIRQLSAYQAGRLSPVEDDAVQEHLATCRECTDSLLNLSEFQELAEAKDLQTVARPRELPSPNQTQASWESLRARLPASRQDTPSTSGQTLPRAGRFRRLSVSQGTIVALAASLIACLIGFPLWIAGHGGPSTDQPLVVYPQGGGEVTRGGENSGQTLTLRLAEAPALVALPLPARASFPSYRVEVWTCGGKPCLSVIADPLPAAIQPRDQPPIAGGRPPRLLAIILGRGQLPSGDYRLRLIGVRGSHDEVIAEHAVRVPSS